MGVLGVTTTPQGEEEEEGETAAEAVPEVSPTFPRAIMLVAAGVTTRVTHHTPAETATTEEQEEGTSRLTASETSEKGRGATLVAGTLPETEVAAAVVVVMVAALEAAWTFWRALER
jgi:hypothetical protein